MALLSSGKNNGKKHESLNLVVVALLLKAGVLAGGASSPPPQNQHPIIGVLTVPVEFGEDCDTLTAETVFPPSQNAEASDAGASCFSAVYVKWLEAAGARVAPIPFDASDDALDAAVAATNGILFTGGEVDLSGTSSPRAAQYMHAAQHLFDAAISADDANNEQVPLWGTCMGLQTLSVLVGGYDVLSMYAFDSEGLSLALDLTETATESQLFGGAMLPSSVVETLSTRNVTTNLHHDGVPPTVFADSQNLTAFFDVLSTNLDRNGSAFVSTIEAKEYPIFATQWHPERNQFEFDLDVDGDDALHIDHSPDAIVAMHMLAVGFVNLARSNTRAYPTPEDEAAALIYNFSPVGTSSSTQAYYFPSATLSAPFINEQQQQQQM